jgi:hypothetical protein
MKNSNNFFLAEVSNSEFPNYLPKKRRLIAKSEITKKSKKSFKFTNNML